MDQTPAGVARIMKMKRVQHMVTADDITAGVFMLDVVWDTPFADVNYTADQNVEAIPPADPATYYVNGFTKAADKISVSIAVVGGSAGEEIVLHAHTMHD